MKKLMILTGALAVFAVCADEVPEVSGITMAQGSGSRLVTITYNLANAPAVVTLDIQTNANGTAWASIGGENIQNVSGDVWKKVAVGDNHTITWRPDLSWPNHKIEDGGARAVVTAWSIDNPPDYLVVDLLATGGAGSERYYPAVEFLPGGLLGNPIYRTSSLVMRKIPAKDVTWAMGSTETEKNYGRDGTCENMHTVTLTNNYYIAVFETTQDQWALVKTDNPTPSKFSVERAMRPVEQVSYNEIRNAANSTKTDAFNYPADPNSKSFLGLLRTKTGLAFDLPSEAQWEFACRAGHGSGSWGNGLPIIASGQDANLAHLGRVYYNDGKVAYLNGTTVVHRDPAWTCGVTNGTANVGSYTPNSWGLYDMHGNVFEWCLDWSEQIITSYGGAVNVDPSTPANTLSGVAGGNRVLRGGCWNFDASYCRPADRRFSYSPSGSYFNIGFRLALPASPAIKSE